MANRNNEVNNGGIVTVSGGAMPANNYTNATVYISRASGSGNVVASPVVLSNSHAVEVDGDGGCYDTVSGAVVDRSKTNLDTIGL